MRDFPNMYLCEGQIWIQNHQIWDFLEAYHAEGVIPTYHPTKTFTHRNVKYEYVSIFSRADRRDPMDDRLPVRRIVFLDESDGIIFKLTHSDVLIHEPRIVDHIDPDYVIHCRDPGRHV